MNQEFTQEQFDQGMWDFFVLEDRRGRFDRRKITEDLFVVVMNLCLFPKEIIPVLKKK